MVQGQIDGEEIKLKYKGRWFKIPASVIGRLLFEEKPVVTIGSVVEVLNVSTYKTEMLKICKLETEVKYYGMGGSFYGADTKEEIADVLHNPAESKVRNISSISPLGEALLGHHINDIVKFNALNGETITYRIISIYK